MLTPVFAQDDLDESTLTTAGTEEIINTGETELPSDIPTRESFMDETAETPSLRWRTAAISSWN